MKTISKITIVICFVFGILGIGGGLYFRNSDLFGCYCIGITGIILIIVGIISSLVNDFLENSAKFLLVLGILVMGAGLYFKIYGTSEEDNIWFYYPLCVTGLISIFWGFAYSLKEYISFEIGYKRDKKNDDKVAPKRDAYYKALKGSNKEEALRLGRHYYSSLRANGRLTIYDEQAIANDINSMR